MNAELKVFDKNDSVRSIIITGNKKAFAGFYIFLFFVKNKKI